MTKSLCVIDGDLISYRASAASETRSILVTNNTHGSSKEFSNRTEFKVWCTENEKDINDYSIKDVQAPEPIENCLHTVKKMLEGIHKASGCDEMKVVVQGKGNFRDDLLLPTKYKSNRLGMQKPIHLGEAKSYLLGKYKAETANGRESDDVLASYAYEGFKGKKRIVQSTVDKDARQCSGWLYDWDKMKQPEFIQGLGEIDANGKGWGRKFLYYQSTVGDPGDGYKPTEIVTYKYGAATAYKHFGSLQTDKECWQRLADLYKMWYPEAFTYTAWNGQEVNADWKWMLQMYLDAAHMQRFEGDRIQLEAVLDKMGIANGT